MDLQSLQRELVRSLFEDGGCLPGLIRGANPIDRLRVYRNNAFNNYRDALTDVYPAITIERLAPGEYAFLAACANGATVAGALIAAIEVDTQFDLTQSLRTQIERGRIADFTLA